MVDANRPILDYKPTGDDDDDEPEERVAPVLFAFGILLLVLAGMWLVVRWVLVEGLRGI